MEEKMLIFGLFWCSNFGGKFIPFAVSRGDWEGIVLTPSITKEDHEKNVK